MGRKPIESEWDDDDSTMVGAVPSNIRGLIQRDDSPCATLTVLTGPETGRTFLVENEARMGRGVDAPVRVLDNSVSRLHARVFSESSVWFLEDLGSQNGTYLEDTAVQRVELVSGATFRLGLLTVIRFEVSTRSQAKLRHALYETSTRDALTGVHNRKYFDERLRAELSYALRHKKELSVMLLDIDFFKRVNDQFGHAAGDEVLRRLAKNVDMMIRAEDVFARYGGEEFVMLARGIPASGAMRFAERIRESAEQLKVMFEGQAIPITVSLGVAMLSCVEHTRNAAGLLAKADERLYQAKHDGRNRVVGPVPSQRPSEG